MKVAVLGGRGYVGCRLVAHLVAAGHQVRFVDRSETSRSGMRRLPDRLIADSVDFLINAAGYTGRPNVDACERRKIACWRGNVDLPLRLAAVMDRVGVPWAHVSSGCIFDGDNAGGNGFREDDPPNFDFNSGRCSFYSGCKAEAERRLAGAPNLYIWRIRMPVDRRPSPRNYLTKLLTYDRLLDARNSLSSLDGFADAAVRCVQQRPEPGKYHLTHPGSVTTRQICQRLSRRTGRTFDFFVSDEQFYRSGHTPRSCCVLDSSKAVRAGFGLQPIEEILDGMIDRYFDTVRRGDDGG